MTSIDNTVIGLASLLASLRRESASIGNIGTLVNAGLSLPGKNIQKKIYRSGTTLTNNKIKYIMKVIKSLENRWILLKGTTGKITSQERGFLDFLRPLMRASLPLKKNVLTSLAKNILLPFGLSAGLSASHAATQKIFMDQELQY